MSERGGWMFSSVVNYPWPGHFTVSLNYKRWCKFVITINGFVVVVVATLFLELWKRYSASIAHRWGLTGYTAQSEHPRPQYLAKLAKKRRKKIRINVVTGAKEPYAPFFTCRLPAMCLSFSVVFLLVSDSLAISWYKSAR